MKREIRIILAVIMVLVGLIFAALCQPPAQSTPNEDRAEVAVVQTPSYDQPVSYVKKTPRPEVELPKISIPSLPTQKSLRPQLVQNHPIKMEEAFPKSRTATTAKDTVPELPEQFPTVKAPLHPKPLKRIHTVIDGDTLRNLALRYLDNEDRWYEIYQANRPLLEDPISLPIGAKLTIPPRDPIAQHASTPQVFPASTERQASLPRSRASAPVSHEVARPIEQRLRNLKVVPCGPMVPVRD